MRINQNIGKLLGFKTFFVYVFADNVYYNISMFGAIVAPGLANERLDMQVHLPCTYIHNIY